MWIDRKFLLSAAVMLGAFALGAVVLAAPQYRAARDAAGTIRSVRQRLATGSESAAGLREMQERLARERQAFESSARTIPASADVASIIRALNRPIDGVQVLDQTFNAGRTPTPVPRVDDGSLSSLPLTIDMVATYDVVHDLLRSVESMPRLIRIASVRVERLADSEHVVKATILLDVIFEPAGQAS
ncbi:MAG: type 4a pilus biogenesis protein PilO [Phycisphaeraceae bacterium]|nr:type 4a pilus biogenesis protein PilO [Phycisphaerales bacterium]QOJ18295.1 MAG: type 4a pilus biogenesis protein PilO [Phycisphaeraceae bacterium]